MQKFDGISPAGSRKVSQIRHFRYFFGKHMLIYGYEEPDGEYPDGDMQEQDYQEE